MLNVRTRIFLLLGAVVVLLTVGLFRLQTLDQRRFARVTDEWSEVRARSFDQYIKRWGEPLETFASYISNWDAMVIAIETKDHALAETHLGDAELARYRADAVWLHGVDGALVYSHNNRYADALREVPLEKGALDKIFASLGTAHFFTQTDLGLLELRGATVHPSRDVKRVTPRKGTLLVGRFWKQSDLDEVGLFTGNTLRLDLPSALNEERARLPRGNVEFKRSLPDWAGAPVAIVTVRSAVPLLAQFEDNSRNMYIWLAIFAVSLLAMLAVALRLWVWGPLEAFSRALRTEDVALIEPMTKDRCEVGDLARLIRTFFDQRLNLLREIQERQQTEKALHQSREQLRQASRMEAIGQLAGGVAHDFNNLLTAIIGHGELLRARVPEQSRMAEDADCIIRAGEQAATLTQQLLAFSRKQVLHPKVLDLNQLVLRSEKLLRRLIGEHIEIQVSAAAARPRVKADPAQIEQVLLNLAVNARDAMPEGGILKISVGDTLIPETRAYDTTTLQAGHYVTIEVADTGVGMSAETKGRIFEPFYTTKEPGKGTGLGLATVYGIVQQSGGALGVESTPGRGTAFHVHLPLESGGELEPDIFRPKVAAPTSPAKGRILVVEDEEAVRELVCSVLSDHGYDVASAEDGRRAMTLAQEQSYEFDLLVSDVVMPHVSGPEVARQLLIHRPDLRVLFMSGYAEDAFSRGDLARDAEILPKPFTPQRLLERVEEALSAEVAAAV